MKNKLLSFYKFNNRSANFYSSKEFLKSLGYPYDFINKIPEIIIKNSFPVLFPFKNIDVKNRKILDIGCGIGLDCLYLEKNGASFVLGIDISFSLLKESLAKIKSVSDIEDMAFKKNKFFDIILFNGSFNQIFKKFLILNFIHKILKKEGIVIICDLMWIGSNKELEMYRKDEDAWIFNIGGCLTEKEIWNIECRTLFKIKFFEKIEEVYPLKKFKLILEKV